MHNLQDASKHKSHKPMVLLNKVILILLLIVRIIANSISNSSNEKK